MKPTNGKRPSAERLLPLGAIVLLTLLAYDPILSGRHAFLDWDDTDNIVANRGIQALDLAHLKWMFTSTVLGVYEPMALLAKAVQVSLFGLDPTGFHLATLLLHCLDALLLFWVARRLFRLAFPGLDEGRATVMSTAAALFFSLHPLRVEVVAWASGQPYALAGLFYLLGVYAYLRHAEGPAKVSAWLGLSVGCYLLAILSKTASITLPLTLLVLDGYPLGRFDLRRSLWEKVPYFLIAGACAIVAKLATVGAQPPGMIDLDFLARLARAAHVLVFPLAKTVWPVDLQPHYAVPREGLSLLNPKYLLEAALVVGVSVVVVLRRTERPWLFALWASHVATLLPVLGLVQHGRPAMAADRYAYLPSFGWALLAGGALTLGTWRRLEPWLRRSAAMGLAAVLMVLTFLQTERWRDTETLWRYALRVDAANELAYNNLGFHLMQQGRNAEAVRFLEGAVALSPEDAMAVLNYGVALENLGRLPEAAELYERSLPYMDKNPLVHFNLGHVLARMGLKEPARREYERALAIDPDLAGARENLSKLTAEP